MTVTDQIKILNRKITQNDTQYDLDREAAKISALSSKNLDKYELLTGKNLGLKRSTIEQTKFEYSPLGKIFNKGLSEDDKKEGLLKRLKNIEDENKVKNKVENKNIKEVTDFVDQPLRFEAKELINEIKTIQKNVDYRKLKIKGGNNVDYDFSDYRTFKELFRDLYYRNTTIDEAESKQEEFNVVLHLLKRYSPKQDKYVTLKNNLVDNSSKFYEGREKIIEGFKNGLFSFYYDRDYEKRMKYEKEEEKTITGIDEFKKYITEKETKINKELFKNYFPFQTPSALLKDLYKINDKEQNIKLVNVINNGLKDLKEEIKKMPEKENEIEDPELIVEIVEESLKFNEQNQQGEGIKILTTNQMLSKLPISLAQLQAINNSEKLKNEIRQLLYSLYRSKNMTKQVYNNLIKPI